MYVGNYYNVEIFRSTLILRLCNKVNWNENKYPVSVFQLHPLFVLDSDQVPF